MELIPAVDLMGGKVVRLYRGEVSKAKIYYTNPLDAAQRWVNEGTKTLHIIDLDAALGTGENITQIEQIVKKVNAKVQVGGGIRSVEKAERLINAGVQRIIIGTKAISERSFAEELIHKYGSQRIVIALDYAKDEVLIEGWTKQSGKKVKEAVEEAKQIGAEYILLTSKEKDGTLSGPDYKTIEEASRSNNLKIIAAGGIENIEHILKLKHAGAYACILGRCLYEGTIKLKEAIKAVVEG
ncbi:MAG: 1-(5-phosphoribosyl)-5-[(5-phosphoribosylamino)methylideneamino]imidazole-4-carboxamide isomerase [Nitrososphaerales archaeon]